MNKNLIPGHVALATGVAIVAVQTIQHKRRIASSRKRVQAQKVKELVALVQAMEIVNRKVMSGDYNKVADPESAIRNDMKFFKMTAQED